MTSRTCNILLLYTDQMRSKYYLILLLFLGTTSYLFSQQNNEKEIANGHLIKDGTITIIDLKTIHKEVIGQPVQLIDIRTSKEYNEGYIDDAIHISIADKEGFIAAFQKLDKEKPVYIYCYSGWRSHRAAKLLVTLGFQQIYDFKGGYKAWSEQ